jgi:hypothetical protein
VSTVSTSCENINTFFLIATIFPDSISLFPASWLHAIDYASIRFHLQPVLRNKSDDQRENNMRYNDSSLLSGIWIP